MASIISRVKKNISSFGKKKSFNIIPSLSVVPIVVRYKSGKYGKFLGTGSFVSDKKILITCEHVIASWNEDYAIMPHVEPPRLYRAVPILRDEEVDLACLKVEGYDPPYSFPLAEDSNITINQLVCAFEYSPFEQVGTYIKFTPANRMGNVTRLRNLNDIFGKAGEQMLELSFPAIKGSSGAPVVLQKSPFSLWGVISRNSAGELFPAQVEKIVDKDGKITEEIKFYLPQGLAIHVKHVRNLLSRI